jgi:hypothetical protein
VHTYLGEVFAAIIGGGFGLVGGFFSTITEKIIVHTMRSDEIKIQEREARVSKELEILQVSKLRKNFIPL